MVWQTVTPLPLQSPSTVGLSCFSKTLWSGRQTPPFPYSPHPKSVCHVSVKHCGLADSPPHFPYSPHPQSVCHVSIKHLVCHTKSPPFPYSPYPQSVCHVSVKHCGLADSPPSPLTVHIQSVCCVSINHRDLRCKVTPFPLQSTSTVSLSCFN